MYLFEYGSYSSYLHCVFNIDTAAEAENLDPATILGQDLVDTITEKNKQPPDVSTILLSYA